MELKDIMQIIKKRIILMIIIVVIFIVGAYLLTKKSKANFETSSVLTVQAMKESSDQYQYGGYYSIQASDLFINTILGWIKSSNIVAEIYQKTGISYDINETNKLGGNIYARKVPPQNIELIISDHNEEVSKKLTDGVIAMIKDKTNQLGMVTNSAANFEIVSSQPITTPIKQNLPLNLMIAFILSLVLGITCVFIVEYLSPKINNGQRVRAIFGKDFISMRSLKTKGLINPDTKAAEKFRFLRANMLIDDTKGKLSAIIAGINEQKITPLLSANLALSFARSGKLTILVDTNFDNPSIHEYFDKQNQYGFSEFLFDEGNIDKYLQKTDEANLRIMSSGIKLSYASDTIERANIKKVLSELEKEADVVLISVPSLNVSSEAFPLFSIIKNSILVVKYGKTTITAASYINDFLDKKDVEKTIIVV
ncbi:MAG TPA: hypothetical protein P5096_00470 [Patescibacteria group bacterium]|nr:hypothetical protein [Patescibacteria group bacterium]